jgi:hypothetical protein
VTDKRPNGVGVLVRTRRSYGWEYLLQQEWNGLWNHTGNVILNENETELDGAARTLSGCLVRVPELALVRSSTWLRIEGSSYECKRFTLFLANVERTFDPEPTSAVPFEWFGETEIWKSFDNFHHAFETEFTTLTGNRWDGD